MAVVHMIFRIRQTDLSELEEEFIEQFKNNLLERLDIDFFNFSIEYFSNENQSNFIEYHLYTYDNFEINLLGLLLDDLRYCFPFLEITISLNLI